MYTAKQRKKIEYCTKINNHTRNTLLKPELNLSNSLKNGNETCFGKFSALNGIFLFLCICRMFDVLCEGILHQ